MKALRFVLLVIAGATAFGLWLRVTHPQWVPPRLWPGSESAPTASTPPVAPSLADARASVLSRLADAPTYGPFFDRLRGTFPSDYLSLIDSTSELVAKGSHVPNPDRMMTDAMRRLRQNRGVLAAQAEAGPLENMFGAQSAVLGQLAAENTALCVDFLYGGSSPDFMAFAAAHRETVERLALANLEAVISGKSSRVERDQPTPDDFDVIARMLKDKGLSEDEIAAVLDGKTFDPPLPEARLCQAGRDYLEAVASMPEADRLKIYALSATLLARS